MSGSSHLERARVFRRKAVLKTKLFALESYLRPVRPPGMIRLGTLYGGWWIPGVEAPGAVAVCVGAGTDVTFDLELQRLGYRVFTVDPTPDSLAYLEQYEDRLNVLPVGVWTSTGRVEFARDAVWSESWMIGSSAPQQADVAGSDSFPVVSLDDLAERVGTRDIAVLKLDIEGAEHAVLRSLVGTDLRPRCLCVEFDDHRAREVVRTVRLLEQHGYALHQMELLNFIFVHEAATA